MGPTHPLPIHSDFASGIGVLFGHDLQCEPIGPVVRRSELVRVHIITVSYVTLNRLERKYLVSGDICIHTQILHKVHIMTC